MPSRTKIPKAVIDWDKRIIYAGASHIRRGEDEGYLARGGAGVGGAMGLQQLPISRLRWCTSGWTSKQLLEAICSSGSLDLSDWVVVVWIGTNDLSFAGPVYHDLKIAADVYESNMNLILNDLYLQKKAKHVFLVTPNPWAELHTFIGHKSIRKYLLGCKGSFVSVIDLYKACFLQREGTGSKGKYVDVSLLKEFFDWDQIPQRRDGKHLSPAGFTLFVSLLESAYNEYMGL
jgi:hypothetical protein